MSTRNVGGCIMYIARFEHIATGQPMQIGVTFLEYLISKVSQDRFLDHLGLDGEQDYFYEGITYVK